MNYTNKIRARYFLVPLVLLVLFLVTGCTSPVDQWSGSAPSKISAIKGFEDCVYAELYTGSRTLYLVRCPGSTVNVQTPAGKTTVNTVIINGKEYAPVEKQ